MRSPAPQPLRRKLRWLLLAAAGVILTVFLAAQEQSVRVSYGESPAAPAEVDPTAGTSDATVPSTAEMTALVDAEEVVRLPGAIAYWDTDRVRAAIGGADLRILVAPPGLDKEERERVAEVGNASLRIYGTEVTGGFYVSTPDSIAGWRARFAVGDVTGPLLALIATLKDEELPSEVDPVQWREPTGAELEAVAADLRTAGRHTADGATLTKVPSAGATAFADAAALYVALPQQPHGGPLPRYGPALTTLFPDRPIVVMYGSWVEYHGPGAAEFAELAAATFYAQFGERLSSYAYGQEQVLGTYLGRMIDIRYAGLFDRPLPYVAFDPLRVTLPVLPWLFAGCVLAFLLLSTRALHRPARTVSPASGPGSSAPARLTALTAVAYELSGLTGPRSDPALARGIVLLEAARNALAEALPHRQVRRLLDRAADELDEAVRNLEFPGYRPAVGLSKEPA